MTSPNSSPPQVKLLYSGVGTFLSYFLRKFTYISMGNETWKIRKYIPKDSEWLESKCSPLCPTFSLQRKDGSWTLCSLYHLLDPPFQASLLECKHCTCRSHCIAPILLWASSFFSSTPSTPSIQQLSKGPLSALDHSHPGGLQPSRWVLATQVGPSHPGGSYSSSWILAIQVGHSHPSGSQSSRWVLVIQVGPTHPAGS